MEKKQDSTNRIASTAASHDFGLVRVDDRLLHGQITAVWCKHQPFTQIVIVDDATAADPFFEEVLTLAA
ncbi:MAG: PTS sugar transporter subunit IIB, partial [Anaerolineae bacterium]|nr:PTS sugar transporter subunit IIB [Anaerolineae bacterium]